MAKAFWQPLRLTLLALTLGGALLVLGKAIVAPTVNAQSSYRLPNTVPLPPWQPLPSATLPSIAESIDSRQYQYRYQTQPLTVALRYMAGDGDVNRFLFFYTPIRQENVRLSVRHQPAIGFYGVLSYNGRVYLSACINARGGSTVTEQQFVQNRHTYDLQITRLLPWLSGREPLLDRRCLWTLMSVPVENTSEKALADAYRSLETAWFDWYRWWQPNFPPA